MERLLSVLLGQALRLMTAFRVPEAVHDQMSDIVGA